MFNKLMYDLLLLFFLLLARKHGRGWGVAPESDAARHGCLCIGAVSFFFFFFFSQIRTGSALICAKPG